MTTVAVLLGILALAVIFLGYKLWSLENELMKGLTDGEKGARVLGFFALW